MINRTSSTRCLKSRTDEWMGTISVIQQNMRQLWSSLLIIDRDTAINKWSIVDKTQKANWYHLMTATESGSPLPGPQPINHDIRIDMTKTAFNTCDRKKTKYQKYKAQDAVTMYIVY
uniref:Phospholipase B-like n=1 Tax=Heterorhabditis bacteriophora TaxID=37862 RepID=A0A1I7X4I5_HETBA